MSYLADKQLPVDLARDITVAADEFGDYVALVIRGQAAVMAPEAALDIALSLIRQATRTYEARAELTSGKRLPAAHVEPPVHE